jgi:Lrp/AsnC family transcriptional regulator, leucine-responsive regulatory protein
MDTPQKYNIRSFEKFPFVILVIDAMFANKFLKKRKMKAEHSEKKLDALDRRILHELTRDGRLSNSQLAEKVGLSASPCWQRTKRLEEDGYIIGYRAILNQEKLGMPETVLIEVTLDRHDDKVLESFGNAMAKMPEVLEVYLITGEYDYIIKVAVAGTRGYEEFLRKSLYKVPGIRQSRSSFALRCLKQGGVTLADPYSVS